MRIELLLHLKHTHLFVCSMILHLLNAFNSNAWPQPQTDVTCDASFFSMAFPETRETKREREKEKRTNIWLFLDVDGKFYVEKCCVKWAYQFACNWLKLPFLLAISSPIAANGIVMCFCFGFAQKVRIRTIYSCTFWNSMLFCGHKQMVYAQRRRMRRSTLGWFPFFSLANTIRVPSG